MVDSYPDTVHATEDNIHTIHYEDADIEHVNMENEQWTYQNTVDNGIANGNSTSLTVDSNENEVLKELFGFFENKPFLKHHSQGFQQFPLVNAYKKEEEQFIKTVRIITIDYLKDKTVLNIINSHTLYKFKQTDEGELKLKARIALCGNEDNLKHFLTTDCTVFPPSGLQIFESIAARFGWIVKRSYVEGAFLKTGNAEREVIVRPARESKMRSTDLWLLLVAVYGLVKRKAGGHFGGNC